MSLDVTSLKREITRMEQEVEDRLLHAGLKPNIVRAHDSRKIVGEIVEKLSKYAKSLGNFTRKASRDADLHHYQLYLLLRHVASEVEAINPVDPSAPEVLRGLQFVVDRFGDQPQAQM